MLECPHSGECASCTLSLSYQDQLKIKLDEFLADFKDLGLPLVQIHTSSAKHFRLRAEFKIFHDAGKIFYALSKASKKHLIIKDCLIVSRQIHALMPRLLDLIAKDPLLKERLFAAEFISSNEGGVLVSLIYHKRLDAAWEQSAQDLCRAIASGAGAKGSGDAGKNSASGADAVSTGAGKTGADENSVSGVGFNVQIIGRARGQKIALQDDFIRAKILDKIYIFKENCFIQPNLKINEQMIAWIQNSARNERGSLLELYCGIGNFTVALSSNFKSILATEISKASIAVAKMVQEENSIKNITFLRMSAQEFTQAANKTREFKRLGGTDLSAYNFSHVLVDPPRAGLDADTLKVAQGIENIIYISCNKDTLKRDLQALQKTHTAQSAAVFDQFAYTKHIEIGLILKAKYAI
ncbi:MAG: tRNA (uridine(54)-C5)-methyltransferase TrmA [Helicobacteraceae bacterium]